MKTALLVSTLVALAASGPAAAGCWATVALDPPPADVGAGQAWSAELTILQHGRNPLPDAAAARPTLTIVNETTGERRTFAAQATAPGAGRYTARVVFPAAGAWSYRVHDGFTTMNGEPVPCARTHTFDAVDVGATGGGGGSSSAPWALVGVLSALGAAGLAAAALVAVRRRREPAPAEAA